MNREEILKELKELNKEHMIVKDESELDKMTDEKLEHLLNFSTFLFKSKRSVRKPI